MGFLGQAALHGFVVGMRSGVVVDFEGCGVQCCCDLIIARSIRSGEGAGEERKRTLERMLSSTGVVDIVESRRMKIGRLRVNIRRSKDLETLSRGLRFS